MGESVLTKSQLGAYASHDDEFLCILKKEDRNFPTLFLAFFDHLVVKREFKLSCTSPSTYEGSPLAHPEYEGMVTSLIIRLNSD